MIIDAKFEVIKKLGDGHQATTFLTKHRETDKEYAIKLFKKNINEMSSREKRMYGNEIAMREQTLHDNLISVLAQNPNASVTNTQPGFKLNSQPQLQMEYIRKGELFHQLQHANGFTEVSIRIILRQIVDGLLWLKKHGMSHNDLKPENILLDEFYIIRLADQGFARKCELRCTDYISGTRMYTSPEINEKRPQNTEKADTFSLGVIMQLLMFRNPCFRDADFRKDKHFDDLVKNGNLAKQLDKVNVSREYKACVLGLLHQNEDQRLSLEALDSNPWLSNFQGDEQDYYMMEFNKKFTKMSEEIEIQKAKDSEA